MGPDAIIAAAAKAGSTVEIRPDGTMLIHAPQQQPQQQPQPPQSPQPEPEAATVEGPPPAPDSDNEGNEDPVPDADEAAPHRDGDAPPEAMSEEVQLRVQKLREERSRLEAENARLKARRTDVQSAPVVAPPGTEKPTRNRRPRAEYKALGGGWWLKRDAASDRWCYVNEASGHSTGSRSCKRARSVPARSKNAAELDYEEGGFFYYDEGGFLRFEPQESPKHKKCPVPLTVWGTQFSLLRDLPYLQPHLLQAYNEKIETAYPDGIPSELKTPHFLARYAKLHQMRAESGAPPLAWLA